ncbi:hypothetical protein [Thalassotalea euphylliae]|uniref:hypothetical protein n=1 Tax=Thalassotalea euphylliae TaxID=1655234 RepID=UPI001C6F14BD|nr:hypothetical protein [Thalassotalea euphylliae]
MALDASPSRISREQGNNPLIGDSHAEPPTPQQLITATAIPTSQLNQLPDEIRRKRRNQAWSIIPPRQSDLFRYQHSAMFWVKANKRWQQVSYAQYRHHTDECYAFAPYQALEADNNTPKFAGGGAANHALNAINPITSQGGQITNVVQSALATNNASTSSNGSTSANTLANTQNNKRGLTQAEINQRFLGASVDPEQALEPHVFISKPNHGEQIELKKSAQVYMRFSQHTMAPADTVESVAKQYTGQADVGLVYPYNFNEGFTRRNPPQAGDTIKVPSGWDTHVEGSVTNASSVEVSWQGASSGSDFISVPKPQPNQMSYWETRLTLDPGLYQLTATANGATHSIDIEVLETNEELYNNKLSRIYKETASTIANGAKASIGNLVPDSVNGIANWLEKLSHQEPGSLGRMNQWVEVDNEVAQGVANDFRKVIAVGTAYFPAIRTGTSGSLLNQLNKNGVKHNPANIVQIGKNADGKIIFLETGNAGAGLQHILQRHGSDFVNRGISYPDIPLAVITAVTKGKIVGYQGKGKGRPIYEINFAGKTQRIAITTGSNGFIVGANPAR